MSKKDSQLNESNQINLNLSKSEQDKIAALRAELIAGEKSGFMSNYDPKKHLESIHKKYL